MGIRFLWNGTHSKGSPFCAIECAYVCERVIRMRSRKGILICVCAIENDVPCMVCVCVLTFFFVVCCSSKCVLFFAYLLCVSGVSLRGHFWKNLPLSSVERTVRVCCVCVCVRVKGNTVQYGLRCVLPACGKCGLRHWNFEISSNRLSKLW